ncbi:MAG: hypothetical protein JWM89_3707 [Acidimicrobiales bacterium]|nr:hypothetical protein [Acidimicrobiales bacterium]
MGRVRPSLARSHVPLHRRLRLDPRGLRARIVLLASALVVALAVGQAMARAHAAEERWGSSTTVLVAAEPVPSGARLDGRLRPVRWPTALLPDGAVRGVVPGTRTSAALTAGTPITRASIDPAGRDRPARALAGRSRVAIAVGEARLGLRRGERVDVWATADPSLTGGRLATRRVARRAVVAAVSTRVVVVAVRPDEVADVAESASLATVTLAAVGDR